MSTLNRRPGQIQYEPIPQAPGATENADARGLSVDPLGKHRYLRWNVDAVPGYDLAPMRDPGPFSNLTGWSTVNIVSYGEVAAYQSSLQYRQ